VESIGTLWVDIPFATEEDSLMELSFGEGTGSLEADVLAFATEVGSPLVNSVLQGIFKYSILGTSHLHSLCCKCSKSRQCWHLC
jgi:hypothetical protein